MEVNFSVETTTASGLVIVSALLFSIFPLVNDLAGHPIPRHIDWVVQVLLFTGIAGGTVYLVIEPALPRLLDSIAKYEG